MEEEIKFDTKFGHKLQGKDPEGLFNEENLSVN